MKSGSRAGGRVGDPQGTPLGPLDPSTRPCSRPTLGWHKARLPGKLGLTPDLQPPSPRRAPLKRKHRGRPHRPPHLRQVGPHRRLECGPPGLPVHRPGRTPGPGPQTLDLPGAVKTPMLHDPLRHRPTELAPERPQVEKTRDRLPEGQREGPSLSSSFHD